MVPGRAVGSPHSSLSASGCGGSAHRAPSAPIAGTSQHRNRGSRNWNRIRTCRRWTQRCPEPTTWSRGRWGSTTHMGQDQPWGTPWAEPGPGLSFPFGKGGGRRAPASSSTWDPAQADPTLLPPHRPPKPCHDPPQGAAGGVPPPPFTPPQSLRSKELYLKIHLCTCTCVRGRAQPPRAARGRGTRVQQQQQQQQDGMRVWGLLGGLRLNPERGHCWPVAPTAPSHHPQPPTTPHPIEQPVPTMTWGHRRLLWAGESRGRRWSCRCRKMWQCPWGRPWRGAAPVLLRWSRGAPGLTGSGPGGPRSRPPSHGRWGRDPSGAGSEPK